MDSTIDLVVALLRRAGYADSLIPWLYNPIEAIRRAPDHFVGRGSEDTRADAETFLEALCMLGAAKRIETMLAAARADMREECAALAETTTIEDDADIGDARRAIAFGIRLLK